MRIIEIILKLAFLGLSVYFIVTGNVFSRLFDIFLIVSILLGLVLMVNTDGSYRYRKTKKQEQRVLALRQIEGGLLVLFACLLTAIGF